MCDDPSMSTALDIDDDLLQAVRELAAVRHVSAGRVVSDVIREGLETLGKVSNVRNGVPLMPRRPVASPPLASRLIDELLDAGD
jgi:hypothetical protein